MGASRNRMIAEVAVLAGIAFLAAGLVLPAVVGTRDAATRAQCTGHLKQLGLALHYHADTYPITTGTKSESAFPAGTVSASGPHPDQRLSWMAEVLPFMEHTAMYNQLDLASGHAAGRNRGVTDTPMRYYACPGSDEYRRIRGGESADPVTHYVGVAGTGADAARLANGDPRAGVFGYDRRTSLPGGIPDGTGNTLLVAETARSPGRWAAGGPATVRGLDPESPRYVGAYRPLGGFHTTGRWPFRRSGGVCVVVMADGSTRYLTDRTAPAVVEALATVAGNESLPADW